MQISVCCLLFAAWLACFVLVATPTLHSRFDCVDVDFSVAIAHTLPLSLSDRPRLLLPPCGRHHSSSRPPGHFHHLPLFVLIFFIGPSPIHSPTVRRGDPLSPVIGVASPLACIRSRDRTATCMLWDDHLNTSRRPISSSVDFACAHIGRPPTDSLLAHSTARP